MFTFALVAFAGAAAQGGMPPGMGGMGGMPPGMGGMGGMPPGMGGMGGMPPGMGGMGGGPPGMGGMGGMPPGMGGMGGGPPGMGGMGGMGGPPPQPPPPKDFPGGAKKARTMLKELKAAFKTKAAVEAFASAPQDPQGRMQTLGPQLENFAGSVVKKYGFDGGFNEAMQSIAAVGGKEQDEKIRAHMEDLGEIITGEKSPRKLKEENDELRAKLAACEAGK